MSVNRSSPSMINEFRPSHYICSFPSLPLIATRCSTMSSSTIPAVELFTTSILSNHKVRHRHERYIAVFTAKKIDYVYHDLASDEDAKKRFRRKAKDPQIPNILVHNEWRGTFEEFEESVEFGELDLFLSIDPKRAVSAAAVPAQEDTPQAEATPPPASASTSSVKLPPAPHAAPKMAPVGTGAGPRRSSMDDFLDSINDSQQELDSMSEADLSSLLEEGESRKAKASHEAAVKAPQSQQLYPGEVPLRLPSGPVKRTYFPSEEAGTRALRLPKMGNGQSPVSPISRSTSTPHGSTSTTSSPGSHTGHAARFSVSQNSSRALAAEASASTSSRVFSARQVRAGLDSGKKLQEVLEDYQPRSTVSTAGISSEIDSLLEDLGLGDLNLSSEEAESFLLDGTVPEGMELGGHRLHKGKGLKARETQAARDVASQARDQAEARRASANVVRQRQASEHQQQDDDDDDEVPRGHGKEASIPVPQVSDKTKALLDKVREKRASRMQMEGAQDVVKQGSDSVKSEEEQADTTTILHADDDEDDEQGKQDESKVGETEAIKEEEKGTGLEGAKAEVEEEEKLPERPMKEDPDKDAGGSDVKRSDSATAKDEAQEPEEVPVKSEPVPESSLPETPPVETEDTTETPRPTSPAIKEEPSAKSAVTSAAPPADGEEIDDLLARLSGAEDLIKDEDGSDQKEPQELKVDIPTVSASPAAEDPSPSPSQPPPTSPPPSASTSTSKRIPRPSRERDHPPVSHSSRRAMDIPRKMSDHNLSSSYNHDHYSSSSSSNSSRTHLTHPTSRTKIPETASQIFQTPSLIRLIRSKIQIPR